MSVYLKTMCEDLYTKPVFTDLDDCCQQGQAAGDQCYKREHNPYPKGEAKHEWWDAGFIWADDQLLGR